MPSISRPTSVLRVAALCFSSGLFAATLIATPAGVELDIAYAKDHPGQKLDLYLPGIREKFCHHRVRPRRQSHVRRQAR